MAGTVNGSVISNWTLGLGRSFARPTERITDFSDDCESQLSIKLP